MGPVQRRNLLVGALMAAVLLTGCASESDLVVRQAPLSADTDARDAAESGDELAQRTTPQAFVFKSGVLEIGDFDPYTLGDNIFDPCTEITPEEFAAAGFDHVEPLPEEYAGLARGLSVCEVLDEDEPQAVSFSTNDANRPVVEQQNMIEDALVSESLPEMFVYYPTSRLSTGCFAQVDTKRGGLSAGVAGLSGHDMREETCRAAVNALERLFFANSHV